MSVFVSASSDDERKKSGHLKKTKIVKKRTPKEKSPTDAKKRLKRIQKRAFIESESEEEPDESVKRHKTLKFPLISSDGVSTSQIEKFTSNKISNNQNNSSEEEDNIILDLDNNTISTHKSVLLNVTANNIHEQQKQRDDLSIKDNNKQDINKKVNSESDSATKSKIIITYHDY